jgi:catechol 2,3-dioxygenase-like lactoylglutathione lyase family enzyme
VSGDVERTTRFYSELLEFPLTEMIDNRDYPGSTHFFFDIGNGNLLAFFDFPGLDSGPYAEVLGGLHHVAISVEPERWADLRAKLDAAGRGVRPAQRDVAVLLRSRTASGSSSSATRSARCTATSSCESPAATLAVGVFSSSGGSTTSSRSTAPSGALGSPECATA